jgi:hypothetical protein
MRKALALSIVLSVGLGLGQVMAEDAQTQVPNLVGTWTSPVKMKWMRAKGTAEGSLTLRVLDQDGPLLKLEKSWETPGAAGNVGGKDVEKATETMVGVVDFDGKSFYLAEQDDIGFYSGRLTAPDMLELVYIEAGHAAVYRAQLTREK